MFILPLALVGALIGVAQGTPQTLQPYETVQLLEPVGVDAEGNVVEADSPEAVQQVTQAVVPLGPQASQVAIKQTGHQRRRLHRGQLGLIRWRIPTPFTNLLEMISPCCCCRSALMLHLRPQW